MAFAAWLGGLRASLLATFAGLLAAWYFFVPQRYSFALQDTPAAVGLVMYLMVSLAFAGFGAALHRARRAAEHRRELLHTTLASIGDAVITTDADARVTYLNPAAQALTGWNSAEAARRPLDEVFRIVNESTRQPAENPAKKALRAGAAVGLANHTVLIRKDGSECAIDDSAAPIRDERGVVSGCILVFRDVSDRRREQQVLERESAMLRLSFDAVIIWRFDGAIVSWSRGAEDLYGFTEREAVGLVTHDLLHTVFPVPFDQVRDAMLRIGQWEGELIHRTQQGRTVTVSSRHQLITGDDGEAYVLEVNRDVSERKAAEEVAAALQAKNHRLMAELTITDRRKDEFLAMLAHELRGPLAPLGNSLEVLKRADADDDQRRRARDTMERQLAQMVRLVDDLIDVSRITRNKLELRKERVEFNSVALQAIEVCRPLVERAGHRFDVRLPEPPVFLDADPARLAQVFTNLLTNACRYTDPGGSISFTGEQQGSDVLVTVKDDGAGIAPDQLDSVFEMFMQVDSSQERAQGGLGIGLALVRRLVKLHGGTVEARSEGLGRGSEFLVRLPLILKAPAARAARPADDPAAAAPRRILIVDDNRDSAVSLAMLLKLAGHATRTAHDGHEALAAAEQFLPDVALLDIGLPKLSGYDVCRRIREAPWGAGMLLIALTGWGQDDQRRKSQEAGFDHHLVKPLDYEVLVSLLAEREAPLNAEE